MHVPPINILTYIILINSVCNYNTETPPIGVLGLSNALNSNIVGKFYLKVYLFQIIKLEKFKCTLKLVLIY